MSKTILMQVDGWTPIIDAVVTETSLMSAVVFGRMWRFCQMEDNVCKASLQKIAEGIGVDKATVQRHADKLCEAGYLKDLTPDLRNKPHVYVDTGKAGIMGTLSATVAQSNVTVADSNATVAQSQLNKVLKKDSKRDKATPAQPTVKANDFPSNVLYREVTERYPVKANWPDVLKYINDVARRIGRQPTKDDLFPYYAAWTAKGWNRASINWLEYAVKGELPRNGNNIPVEVEKELILVY